MQITKQAVVILSLTSDNEMLKRDHALGKLWHIVA